MLLFQQMALAAYSCPLTERSEPVPARQAAMVGCEDMGMSAPDPEAPALCHQDCQGDHAAKSDARTPQPAAHIAVPLYTVSTDAFSAPIHRRDHFSVRPSHADPPITQRFCRLLI
jgi:hypothetical protein